MKRSPSRSLGGSILSLCLGCVGVAAYSALAQPGCGGERAPETELASSAATAKYDWMQFGGDARHTSNNTLESTITPSNVGGLKQVFQVKLPATVQSAPVVLTGVSTPSGTRDLVFVDSGSGDVVALDASTGATIWSHKNSGTTPTVSSPAVDPSRAFVYAYGLDGKVHKYAVGDGAETTTGGWPEVTSLKTNVEKGGSALTIASSGGNTYLYAPNGGYFGDGWWAIKSSVLSTPFASRK